MMYLLQQWATHTLFTGAVRNVMTKKRLCIFTCYEVIITTFEHVNMFEKCLLTNIQH